MAANRPASLYRAVERFPPSPKDYKSPLARGRQLPEGATDEDIRSWGSVSSWETEKLAQIAARKILSAKWIVRYDIPPGATVEIEKTGPPGHWDIRASADELDRYLVRDYRVAVPPREAGKP